MKKEWISVEEKKSPENLFVFVVIHDEKRNLCKDYAAIRARINDFWIDGKGIRRDEDGFVTHWMLIPEYPKKKEEPIILESQKKTELKKPVEWVQLTKWREYSSFPSYGTMRNIVNRRSKNGASEFLSVINGRFYVNVEKFYDWLKKQKP